MDNPPVYQKISSRLQNAEKILLVCHRQPDADALGSLAALGHWLDSQEKIYDKFCVNQAPGNLAWLLNFEPLISDPQQLACQNYDTIVVLDSGDLKFAGLQDWLVSLPAQPYIINIDHHQTNEHFGHLNLVWPKAVSTTEILYHFFKSLNFMPPPKTANALLAGIIYDTYNFTNPNTTESALTVAAHLLSAGASLARISDLILKNKTLETLKAWGGILTHLNFNPRLGSVSTIILQNENETGLAEIDLMEGVANFLNNLTGVKVVIILQQQPGGLIKGSLRTNDDLIDVSRLAKMLGGGGHRKAAGFRLKGELIKAENGPWQIK